MQNDKKFQHISAVERKEIALLMGKGYSQKDIASALGRSKSGISDEIRINSVNGHYDPKQANKKARDRRRDSKYQGMKIVQRPKLQEYVETKVRLGWSPELIAGRIKEIDSHIPYVSHRGIYKFIYSVYGRRIESYLVRKDKHPKTKSYSSEKLTDRVFIDERPKIIDNQGRFGDWEGDLIVSGKYGKGVLLVLYERKSCYVLIKRLMTTSPDVINEAFRRLTGNILCMNSMTLDNDLAFRKHPELSEKLGANIFFCHPYHSWEKGGVESVNGMIRRYIKKGSDISQYEDDYIHEVQEKLNDRPRKRLKYKTPNEIMTENHQFRYCKPIPDMGQFNHLKTPLQVFGLRV